jgi:ATP-dependent NAD(P)H-hydrate dehydratase
MASQTPEMSASTKSLLAKAQRLVPPMLESFHKGLSLFQDTYIIIALTLIAGQLGRVAVLGGSVDYTGAPYFSAMASARLGCDMVKSST